VRINVLPRAGLTAIVVLQGCASSLPKERIELLRRTRGNLRALQEHLRHSDIQTTTLYTRLTPKHP
jgi:integrase